MPPASNLLIGVRAKIERANRHVQDLGAMVQRFRDNDVCKISAEYQGDATDGQPLYVLRAVEVPTVPSAILTTIGDTLFNLRSALDQLAFALCDISGKPEGTLKRIYFPISESQEKYQTTGAEVRRLAKPAAIEVLDAIQPYKGGKADVLWVLETLNNIDKHRLLVAAAVRIGVMDWRPVFAEGARRAGAPEESVQRLLDQGGPVITIGGCEPLEAGEILFTVPGDSKPYEHVKFGVDVAVNEPRIGGCKPLLPLVHEIADFVEGTVSLLGEYV